uniref:Uncharacterized protein n=1 Tax=Romanomermis culicivorax TaxID=13658 RepID=A0A915J1W1_ROMCU
MKLVWYKPRANKVDNPEEAMELQNLFVLQQYGGNKISFVKISHGIVCTLLVTFISIISHVHQQRFKTDFMKYKN